MLNSIDFLPSKTQIHRSYFIRSIYLSLSIIMMHQETLYCKTPLLESIPLGKLCGIPVYLKMENVQPSGSFKIRGISNLISKSRKQSITKLVSASGGNAGMATAYAGKILNIPTTVIIPGNVPKLMISKLEQQGANVKVFGRILLEAQEKALELSEDSSTLYVDPSSHTLIWEGIESLVEEIVDQCPHTLSAIVLSVGGGGLLCGVLQGLQKKGLNTPVVAMETEGSHCFSAALKAGKSVSIGDITSIAKTLGAVSVTPHVFDLLPQSDVISEVVQDKDAVNACIQFANDSRVLVEPSCGAALSAGYSNIIPRLIDEGKIKRDGAVVFIVCGGNGVTLELLEEWKNIVGL